MTRRIQLCTATRLTPLLAHLADTMRTAPLPPREDEVIVVQSQGMRRWIILQLADVLGCAGSMQLPFPARFIHSVADRIDPPRGALDGADAYGREAMTWRIESLLRVLPDDEVNAPLHRYLMGKDERARFGLAERIADRFDDYQLYRADLLAAWEAGDDTPDTVHARWQAALWRDVVRDTIAANPAAPPHAGTRLRQLVDRLATGEAPYGLPTRVTVFGVSALPPLFIDVLAALAQHVPVAIYAATLPDGEGHPLAEAFGAQSHEFMALLRATGAVHQVLDDPVPHTGTLLSALQHELTSGDGGTMPLEPSLDDASLRVHSAHGNVRQLEIVRDQLLDALASDPTLRPHDLLLLVPDAAAWAPLVDAVFGINDPDAPRIPYRMADRPARGEDPAASALTMLLALPGGRFTHGELFELLAQPLVHGAAGLSELQVDALASLTREANVRWGYDATSRVALGLPEYEDASWRASLDRLLLGIVTGRQDDLVLGLLPHGGDTTGDADAVARLAAWVDAVARVTSGWSASHRLEQWVALMQEAVDLLFGAATQRDAESMASVTELLDCLRRLSRTADYSGDVPFGVVRDWIEGQLGVDSFGSSFLTGGMTVAALKPMRSLPFRVIAVVGLDEGVFPRRDRRAAFDLLDRERRAGDRDLRSDDRQLFLDLMLAAQDRLILGWSGRAVHDNSPCASSVVIDELLDHLDRRSGNGGSAARDALLVQHPLQPFSRRYFEVARDPRLFTFSSAHARSAQASMQERGGDLPFITSPLTATPRHRGAGFELTIAELADCWCNASRYFCRQSLGFTIGDWSDESSDDELLVPSRMLQGGVKARMLATALAGDDDIVRDVRRLQGTGELPPLALGAAWAAELREGVVAALQAVPLDIPPSRLPISIGGDGWRVSGTLDGVRGDARYVVRAGTFRPNHEIRAWIEHIVMCAAREAAADDPAAQSLIPSTSVLVGVSSEKGVHKPKLCDRHEAVPNATAVLSALMSAARDGRDAPLPFFPQAAMAWLKALRGNAKLKKNARPRDPQFDAIAAYDTDGGFAGMPGDHADPHVALCFRGVHPLEDRWHDFEALATLVLGARLP
ncbi:MAG TPA: exodeoxyribonuclease V subunit gamma [Gemmatimonadaceae bacterium]|nr:exodeoxyribonuclease V subunit gamma [Gemmatimonadaceae bacterium]